jgi:sugar lactone lactonase YvrE
LPEGEQLNESQIRDHLHVRTIRVAFNFIQLTRLFGGRSMTRNALLGAIAIVAVGCTTKENPPAQDTTHHDSTAAAQSTAATAQKIGEATGLKTPESVKYDADLDVYFVSNIDGNPSGKDGKGEITKIRADSTGTSMPFIESGKNGVTLNAPKGLAIKGDTLWVADIDAVRAFNKRTGAPISSVDLRGQKATFLNDVAIGGDGDVYVTDTGIAFDAKGQVSHPGVNRVFKIAGKTATEAAKGDSIQSPNGITWDSANNRFLIATFSGNDVLAWAPGSDKVTHVASGPGQYDGIEVLSDGRILVSSWADSAVHVIQNGKMSALVHNVNAPADIGLDTKRNVLAVPRFSDNKVEFFKVP